jgi:hypothetical protein
VAATAVALLVAPQAGAAVARDALIRPGVGIAKARLGMTATQVRAAMGRPLAVLPQQAGFGRRAVEWQYGYGAYTVRLEGRGDALRVVAVATTAYRERTPEGLGVGTLESRVERAYGARIRCERLRTGAAGEGRSTAIVVLDRDRDCVVAHTNGTQTVFVTWMGPQRPSQAAPTAAEWEEAATVLEVVVRR